MFFLPRNAEKCIFIIKPFAHFLRRKHNKTRHRSSSWQPGGTNSRARCKQSAEAQSRTYLETLSSRNITLKTGCGATAPSNRADRESSCSEWIVASVVSTPSGNGTRPAVFVPLIGFSLSRQGVATVSPLVSSSITSTSVSILTSITRTSLSIAARRNHRDSRARLSFLGTRCGSSAPRREFPSYVSSRWYLCVDRAAIDAWRNNKTRACA